MWSCGVVGVRVPRPEPNRQQFVGVVAPHPERVEPEPAFEVGRRLFLLRMRGHQRGIDVEHDRLAEIGAGNRRRRHPGRQLRPDVAAGPRPGRRRSASTPAGVTSSNARHTVAGDATGPEQPVLMAQCVDVGDRLAARDQDRRHIHQHPSPIMDRDEPAPANACRQAPR